MRREQIESTWSYISIDRKTNTLQKTTLDYTIVLIDGKVTRAFNHSYTRKGAFSFNSISPQSEVFNYFRNQFEKITTN